MRRTMRAQRGFTLLEMMIAMTLSVVLLGILTAGTRSVIDDWQDSNSPFEARLDRTLVLLQLEQALLGANPHSYVDQETLEQYVYFDGTEESVTWVSTVSPQAKQELTAWQLLAGERDGVVLKAVPAFADDPTLRLEDVNGTLALSGMELTLSYLTLDDTGRVDWLEEWSGAERQVLPLAVRLELVELGRSGAAATTELIVPFRNRQHETLQPVDLE